jgi:hypothetical protein
VIRTFALCVAIAVTVGFLLQGLRVDLFKSSRIPEDAIGCDWFGYLRQARLFRENGVVGGLNTAIRDERTRYLVGVGKRLGAPVASWEQGVAPHCHHYEAATDQVILQYPPATGFLFSFFEEGTQARSGFAVSMLIVFTASLLIAASARTWTVPLLVLALGSVFYSGFFRFSEDWSIPLSGAILLVAGWLTVWLSLASAQTDRILRSACLGVVLGLAVDVRMMNLLIAIGPLGILSGKFLKRPDSSSLWPPLAALGGLIVGMLPVFVFNTINAGHPLTTTYPSYDASLPIFTWEMVAKAVRFYLIDESFNRFFTLGAALVLPVIIQRQQLATERVAQAASAGALTFAVSLAYLFTHEILVPYYLFPAAAYAAATAFFALVASETQRAGQEGTDGLPVIARAVIVVAALVAVVPIVRAQPRPLSPLFAGSARVSAIEPSAIVWGDLGTGNVSYFLHRQAAKLIELSRPMQERFISELERDGVRQYLLNDSERMEEMINRLAKEGRVRKSTRVLEYDVYLIENGASAVSESANR